jgi:hypothetical protein
MSNDLADLRAACAGLAYPSESDYPLTVFEWSGEPLEARAAVEQNAGLHELRETSLAEFFAAFPDAGDPASPAGNLFQVIRKELHEPRVFRTGGAEVRVFLIGRDRSGSWAGFETVSIET